MEFWTFVYHSLAKQWVKVYYINRIRSILYRFKEKRRRRRRNRMVKENLRYCFRCRIENEDTNNGSSLTIQMSSVSFNIKFVGVEISVFTLICFYDKLINYVFTKICQQLRNSQALQLIMLWVNKFPLQLRSYLAYIYIDS